MRFDFGRLFQEKTKDHTMNGLVYIPTDKDLWPKSWKEVEYKEYSRFKSIKLPAPIPKTFSHTEILKRKSWRDFSESMKSISLQEISNIIYYSCGELPENNNKENEKKIHIVKKRRVQASAGGMYPLEIYLINFVESKTENSLERKCYHYNVKNHTLEELWYTKIENKKDINKYFSYEWATDSKLAIIISGVTKRVTKKYGERGYKYMYQEVGTVAHNIQLNSTLEHRKSVIMGGINEVNIEDLLDLDGTNEAVISGVLLG